MANTSSGCSLVQQGRRGVSLPCFPNIVPANVIEMLAVDHCFITISYHLILFLLRYQAQKALSHHQIGLQRENDLPKVSETCDFTVRAGLWASEGKGYIRPIPCQHFYPKTRSVRDVGSLVRVSESVFYVWNQSSSN